ncbi:RNA polymerase sigma factor SigZ [Acetobacterium sp.]|uniref:RNA polymerase sigma factor SigZ n=1 Tax=Acetobacterium sp. TaxID=1872094 RepID=UPI0035934501
MIGCIWEEFSGPLKWYINKRVANKEDAEDLLQEVFLKIHNNLRYLEDEKKIHAWIYTITKNTIKDYYRKNSRMPELTELDENISEHNPLELTASREIAACLKGMIHNLPEKYKAVILLSEFEKLSQKEISKKLGISVSAVKSRVQRGRIMLKEMLLGCCQLEFDSLGHLIDYEHKEETCRFCKKIDV